MLYLANYLSAALACAATLFALDCPLTAVEGALVCASAALFSVATLYALRPEQLAAWHRRRARSLFERRSSISAIWPLAIVGFLALALAEAAHDRLAGWLS